MTAAETALATPKLSFGPVIQGTFGVLKRNLGTFVALALLLEIGPFLLIGMGFLQLASGGMVAGGTWLSVGYLAMTVASAILTPALVHGAVADLNSRKPTLGECLTSGVRHALPVFVILLLSGLGMAFGFILFFVPGFMLLVAWLVAAPAQVVEKTGVFAAFGRSRFLTRGSRWRIFWLLVLYVVVYLAVQQSIMGVATMFTGPMATAAANPLSAMTPAYLVVTSVMTVANTLVSYTGLAVIYYELRRLKEGIGPEALASIFD
jgi:hypothetical protein